MKNVETWQNQQQLEDEVDHMFEESDAHAHEIMRQIAALAIGKYGREVEGAEVLTQ